MPLLPPAQPVGFPNVFTPLSCGFSAVSDDLHPVRWYSLINPPMTVCRRIARAAAPGPRPLALRQHPPELAGRLDRMAELTGTAPRRVWRVVRESARRGVTSQTFPRRAPYSRHERT